MKKILWCLDAWDDYVYWQTQDNKTLNKINKLLNSIMRHGYNCIGKPEPLKNEFSGYWSVRIDDVNRLVFRIYDDYIEIAMCKNHYD